MKQRCIGFDVGGANIKCADTDGFARQVEFPLWKRPQELADALREIVRALPHPAYDGCGLTMTGELADCFATKREGVVHIASAVESACAGCGSLHVYAIPGEWLSAREAGCRPHAVAAANWHALASLLCQDLRTPQALLVDMGSTTTDLIPLTQDGPAARGTTDTERLQHGELLYTGVVRTPVCAVLQTVPYRGTRCHIAAELFATTADAYVLLGQIPEEPLRCDTADGRPRTRAFAKARLARMVCADVENFDDVDALAMAHAVADAHADSLAAAIDFVIQRDQLYGQPLVLCGEGESVVRDAAQRLSYSIDTLSWQDLRGADVSRVAPAHAVAKLLQQWSESAM